MIKAAWDYSGITKQYSHVQEVSYINIRTNNHIVLQAAYRF